MKNGNNAGYEWKSMSTMANIRNLYYLPNLDSGYTTILFNGKQFSIFEHYEDMLTYNFGDYMKLPPESERICKHNPLKVQF